MHARLPDLPLDIIGDVHGEYEALQALLTVLGYDEAGRHPQGRHLCFVGDLCDRGPDSPRVVRFVMALEAAGRATAVLGNHEINLLREKRKPGNDWFWNEERPRDAKYAPWTTLSTDSERSEILQFFGRLPVVASRPDLRMVHAAWHSPSLHRVASAPAQLTLNDWFGQLEDEIDAELDRSGVRAASRAEKAAWHQHLEDPKAEIPLLPAVARNNVARQMAHPVRVLASGVERHAHTPFFAGGEWRFSQRVRWWDDYAESTPVIIGHYWRPYRASEYVKHIPGEEALFDGVAPQAWHGQRNNVFCVDFSVGIRWLERRAGTVGAATRLAALRWPERELVFENGLCLQTTGFGGDALTR